MKTFIIIVAIVQLLVSQTHSEEIKKQAEIAAKALVDGDYETLIKYTYPKLIERMGGKDYFMNIINAGKAQMASQGTTLEKFTIGTPSDVVKAGNELHALVPQTLTMKVKNGKMKTDGYLIAISKDNGSHWFFLDTSTLNMENIKMILPNYNMALVIPEKKPPTFSGE